jgi:hypothetical protein
VTAADAAGNTAAKKTAVIKVSPALTVNAVTTPTRENSQTIGGTVQSGISKVEVFKGTTKLGDAVVDGTNWSYQILSMTANTTNSYTIKATDSFGNTTSAKVAIRCDTVAPALTISKVSPATQNSKSISGTREANATISITTKDGATIGQVNYPTTTTWNCTISDLPSGASSYSVIATDAAGNSTAKSATITYTPPI